MVASAWENYFGLQIEENKLPIPTKEYKFLTNRRFRFDYAWVTEKFAVEVDGGVFAGGRHTSGKGYTMDCEKMNLALLEGWKVMRVTTGQVSNGKAIEWLNEYFKRYVLNDT